MVALYGDKWKYFYKDSNTSTSFHYANTVNAQVNTNIAIREKWENTGNAVGKTDKYATSHYTKTVKKDKNGKVTSTTYNYPWTLTAHDFKFNTPSNARIDFVVVQVCMKSHKDGKAEFPSARFCVNNKSASVKDSKVPTGWHSGSYYDTSEKLLSTSDKVETYFISGDDFRKGGYTADNLNDPFFGVDLKFADKCDSQKIGVKWVRCRLFYTLPTYTLTHNQDLGHTEKNADITKTGVNKTVKFVLKQPTKANGGSQTFELVVPFGTELVSATANGGSFNQNNNRWVVNCSANTTASLNVTFKDYTVDTQKISLNWVAGTYTKPKPPSKDYWYYSNVGTVDDYGSVTTQLITKSPHRRETCCFLISTKLESTDNNSIQLDISKNFTYDYISCELVSSNDSRVSISSSNSNAIVLNVPEDKIVNVTLKYCVRPLVSGSKWIEVKVHNGGTNYNRVPVSIKEAYEYHFSSKKSADTDAIVYTILNADNTAFVSHRIASELTTGAYILPCRVKEHDSLMVQSNPAIHMYKWEQLDYIGCVPLEHLHFDPKSTYKDKLLDSHYKNKRYMGKELASEEDITLNVRLHPQEVTTIQGLIDMDKPIPINANHRCFEGDSLNHRGWAEIYGIKAEKTNEHWYKCDIDVKYLTHNLNTRFKINKGTKTFSKYEMPKMLVESVESGDALMSGNETHDYFIVDTDGGYIFNEEEVNTKWYTNEDGKIVIFIVSGMVDELNYIYETYDPNDEGLIEIITGDTEVEFEDVLQTILEEGYTIINAQIGVPIEVDDTEYSNENERNVFTLDEGQHFTIKTKDPLSTTAQIGFDWTSTFLTENKENNISRIVRLVDTKTNNAMFEYEYCDFDFSEYNNTPTTIDGEDDEYVGDAYIACHIIARVYNKGDYDEAYNKDIHLPVTLMDEDEDDDDYIPLFGSYLTFYINRNILTVEDSGASGQEVKTDGIKLEGNSYRWEVEFKNKNTDGEDNDIVTYVDVNVLDSLLSSQYAHKYDDMIISPFPVSDKELIFTRKGEEGVMYYYDNDDEEFSYLIEPYYQYYNGVDLRASTDKTSSISVFNLNYGYKTVYLENGLVSLGINRLNGQMYLRKWDDDSKEYITLFYFQLQNYDDVNINNISDDRIELQASNTLISMYRGHPYVILKHRLEDIDIINQFGTVWAEEVGDQKSDYPAYFDLLNTQNLLPPCVGSKNQIDRDCITVLECGDTIDCENTKDVCDIYDFETGDVFECPNLQEVQIELNLQSEIKEDTATTLNISTSDLVNGDKVYFLIDGDVLDQEEFVMTYPNPVNYTFPDPREYQVSAVFVGDDNRSYAIAPTRTVYAKPLAPIHDPTPGGGGGGGSDPCPQPSTGKYKMEVIAPKKFTYRDNKEWKVRLTRGDKPVCGKVIEIVDFNYINTEKTDANGYVTLKNKHIHTMPKKYKIGARFFEGTTHKPLAKKFVEVEVKKADVEFKMDTDDYAKTTGNNIKINLHHKDHNDWDIENAKVTVYINGKARTKKTNKNGNVYFKINKKGEYKYKCVYGGSKYYNKAKASFKERVKDPKKGE